MLVKSLSDLFKKILNKIIKNKDTNLKVNKRVRKFFRYNIKWTLNNIKMNIFYFFFNKKKIIRFNFSPKK